MMFFNTHRIVATAVAMGVLLMAPITEAAEGQPCIEGEDNCVCENGECTLVEDLGGTTTKNKGSDPDEGGNKPGPFSLDVQADLDGDNQALVFEAALVIPRVWLEVDLTLRGRPLFGDDLELGGVYTGVRLRPLVMRAGFLRIMPTLGAGARVTRVNIDPREDAPRANLFGVAGSADVTAAVPLSKRFWLTAGAGVEVTRIVEHPPFVDAVDRTQVDARVRVGVRF